MKLISNTLVNIRYIRDQIRAIATIRLILFNNILSRGLLQARKHFELYKSTQLIYMKMLDHTFR